MHWAVELPSLPGAPVQVSAESWKTALTEARKGTGLSKFRVDFEEDGTVRVHDLITNERFALRPLSADPSASPPVPSPQVEPAIAAIPLVAPTPSATAPSPTSVVPLPPGAKLPAARTGSVVPAPPSVAPAPKAPSQPAMPAVTPWPKPANPLASTQITGTPATFAAAVASVSAATATPPSQAVNANNSRAPTAAPPSSPEALVSRPSQSTMAAQGQPNSSELRLPATATLFHQRDRERSPGNDLTYRERLIAVAPGTPQSQATEIARDVWRQLAQILLPLPPGKFVSIAVFDHAFKSRPERPPLAVLQWKDWRSAEPEVSYPGSTASIPPGPPPTIPPPSAPIAVPTPTPSAPISTVGTPTPVAPPQPEAVTAVIAAQTAPALTPQPLQNPSQSQMSAVRPSMAPAHTVAFGAMSAQITAAITEAQAASVLESKQLPTPSVPPSPAVAVPTAESSVSATPSAPPSQPPFGQGPDHSIPVPLVQVAPPVPLVQPAPAPLTQPKSTPSVPPAMQPPVRASFPAMQAVPAQPPPTQRATRRTDELLGDAFEALQDLAFLREQSEACEFVARITAELLPQTQIALSLYDIDHDELVLEISPDPSRKGTRVKIVRGNPRSDATIRTNTVELNEWQPDAYLPSTPTGPAIFAGVAHDSRLFGVLELHRPEGQRVFDQAEQGAVSYVATQLGQFLAEHSRRVGFKDEQSDNARNRRR